MKASFEFLSRERLKDLFNYWRFLDFSDLRKMRLLLV
jgi:hypothetical protein